MPTRKEETDAAFTRELAAVRGEEWVLKLVENAPPLTAHQREVLRAALHDPIDDLPAAA